MVLFEILALASISFALMPIPVIDKYIEPKFGSKLRDYKEQARLRLSEKLESAAKSLRSVESPSDEKTQVLVDELLSDSKDLVSFPSSLAAFFDQRTQLFLLGIASFLLSASSISYDNSPLPLPTTAGSSPSTVTLGQVSILVFGILILGTVRFVTTLFDLDKKAFEMDTSTSFQSSFTSSPPYVTQFLTKALTDGRIRYEKDVRTRGYSFDYLIPSLAGARYVIETKTSFSRFSELDFTAQRIKEILPGTRRILFFGTPVPLDRKERLKKTWDYVFDVTEVERLLSLVSSSH